MRQSKNLGAAANFKFVLDEAQGKYFMWGACDDIRSPDFVEVNYKFLSEKSGICSFDFPEWIWWPEPGEDLVSFALDSEVVSLFSWKF